jgi:WD40 repeat protein
LKKALTRLVALVALVGLGLPTVPALAQAPAARAEAKSGRLLTEGGQLTSLSGRSQMLTSTLWCPSTFSPDGAMIATLKRGPSAVCLQGPIQIRRAQGRTTTVPTPSGSVRALAWSPDQRQITVLVQRSGTYAIWVLDVRGSGRRLLYSGDGSAGSPTRDLAWSPDGARIAFVGASRTTRANDDQIYTIPVAGGAPTPYNVSYVDPDCADQRAVCRVLSFALPRWSPDGTALLVNVVDSRRSANYKLGDWTASSATLVEGATEPHVVRQIASAQDLRHLRTTASTTNPSFWSADGSTILSPVESQVGPWTSGGSVAYWRTDLASGTSTRVTGARVYDWQPCPTGTCSAWPRASRPKVTVTARWNPHKHKKMRVTGTVRPRQDGFVRVDVQVRAGGRWYPYLSHSVATEGKRVFHTEMVPRADPPGDACRVVTTYRQVFRKVQKVRC